MDTERGRARLQCLLGIVCGWTSNGNFCDADGQRQSIEFWNDVIVPTVGWHVSGNRMLCDHDGMGVSGWWVRAERILESDEQRAGYATQQFFQLQWRRLVEQQFKLRRIVLQQ